jgi:hypothetical protein
MEALPRSARVIGRRPDLVALSDSPPLGVPEDFYARVAEIVRSRTVPVALDTSGIPLKAVEHGVDLLKPNLRELRELTGEALVGEPSWVKACSGLVSTGKTKIVSPDACTSRRAPGCAGPCATRNATRNRGGEHGRRRRQLRRRDVSSACNGPTYGGGVPLGRCYRLGGSADPANRVLQRHRRP